VPVFPPTGGVGTSSPGRITYRGTCWRICCASASACDSIWTRRFVRSIRYAQETTVRGSSQPSAALMAQQNPL